SEAKSPPLQGMIFMQDGTTPHIRRCIQQVLGSIGHGITNSRASDLAYRVRGSTLIESRQPHRDEALEFTPVTSPVGQLEVWE
ncbi:hypothetical protein NPIL_93271, partial [Nephila pilipes]